MMLYYTFRLFYCKCLWISKTAAFTSSFNIVVILTVLVPWENSTWLMSLKAYLCTIRWYKSNSALKQAARSAPSCDFNAGLVEHSGFVQQSCRICRLLTQNNRLEQAAGANYGAASMQHSSMPCRSDNLLDAPPAQQ